MKTATRVILSLVVVTCVACQGGRIPCPSLKTAKLHKSIKPSSVSFSARVSQPPESEMQREKSSRPSESHYIRNISMEEWDCPKPGSKRYMPKSVKENIRRNWKKIESDSKGKPSLDVPSDQR